MSDSELPLSDLQCTVDQLLQVDAEVQRKPRALFLLRLKEGRCLSQVAVNEVVSACQELFKHTVSRVQAGVRERLALHGVDSYDIPDLANFLETIQDPFDGLHSTYLQEKFYREKLGCIVSI